MKAAVCVAHSGAEGIIVQEVARLWDLLPHTGPSQPPASPGKGGSRLFSAAVFIS